MQFRWIYKLSTVTFIRLYILYSFISLALFVGLGAVLDKGMLTTFLIVVGWIPYILLLVILFGIEYVKNKIYQGPLYISVYTITFVLILLTQIATLLFTQLSSCGLVGPYITLYEIVFLQVNVEELCSVYKSPETTPKNSFEDISSISILAYLTVLYVTAIGSMLTAQSTTKKIRL